MSMIQLTKLWAWFTLWSCFTLYRYRSRVLDSDFSF